MLKQRLIDSADLMELIGDIALVGIGTLALDKIFRVLINLMFVLGIQIGNAL